MVMFVLALALALHPWPSVYARGMHERATVMTFWQPCFFFFLTGRKQLTAFMPFVFVPVRRQQLLCAGAAWAAFLCRCGVSSSLFFAQLLSCSFLHYERDNELCLRILVVVALFGWSRIVQQVLSTDAAVAAMASAGEVRGVLCIVAKAAIVVRTGGHKFWHFNTAGTAAVWRVPMRVPILWAPRRHCLGSPRAWHQ